MRKKGTIKFLNQNQKFGFIICSEDEKEYYVHIKDIATLAKEGDRVFFELEERKRGPQAINVTKIF